MPSIQQIGLSMKIDRLPTHDLTNGWTNILEQRQSSPPLTTDIRVDMLVIGAGAAGLAAARRAAEINPNRTVALVEAGRLGDGASARNSGFVIDLPHNVGADLDDLDTLKRSLRLARAAWQHLNEIVTTHKIECQWSRQGQLMAARSQSGEKVLDTFIKGLDLLGETYTDMNSGAVRTRTGMTYYRRAIHTPGTVLMQPAALVRGLGDSLPKNVSFFENTPVLEIDYGSKVTAITKGGKIIADRCVLAVNGFAPFLGHLKRKIFTIQAFASMTRVLTDEEQAALGDPEDWGLVPAMAFGGPTMRYTMDKRIVMRSFWGKRQSDVVRSGDYRRSRYLQLQQIQDRFPIIQGDPIEDTWTGQLGLASNFAPGFGKIRENVWSAMIQNGVGMTKGTMSGLLAADALNGINSQLLEDIEAMGNPGQLPPQPILSMGIWAKVKWWEWSQRAER
jgi:glycine/D-amino acid oxidase-like deaminating enzyme